MPTQVLSDLSFTLAHIAQDGPPVTVPSIDSPAGPAADPASGGGQPTASPFGGSSMFLILLLMMGFLILTTVMSSRREKKRVGEMLSSLKRGDRVQTAGGMIGTVDQVKDGEVVLRIDDVGGAKAHFAKTAVQQVIRSAKSGPKSDDADGES